MYQKYFIINLNKRIYIFLVENQKINNSLENILFKDINLDISEYSNAESKLDNSLIFFYLDDLLDFYFAKKNNLVFGKILKKKKEIKNYNLKNS